MSTIPIHPYLPDTDHDLYLAQWWGHLRDSGDLTRLFATAEQPFSTFMSTMRRPTDVVFQLDPTNKFIIRLAYFQPFTIGALSGLWLHADHRRSRSALEFVLEVLDHATRTWPVIVGITKQPELLDAHRNLGYTISEPISAAWDGEPAWFLTLTRAGFEEARHGRQQTIGRVEGAGAAEPIAVRHLEPAPELVGGPGEPARPDGGDCPDDPDAHDADELRPVGVQQIDDLSERQPRPKPTRRHAIRPAPKV